MESTEDLIAGLHDGFALNHYAVSLTALYLYDYLLTFADEVRYAWGGKKTWVFFLFLVNRYIPLLYRFWIIFQVTWPGYTQELCSRAAFSYILIHFLCSWIAQAVLIMRIYAITLKNLSITACLVLLSTVQLGLGMYHTALVIMTPRLTFPCIVAYVLYPILLNPAIPSREIPGLRLHICLLPRYRALEITNTVFAIPFDVIIFAATIYSAARQGVATRVPGSGMPSILRTLMRDGALYFAVIFTSHVVFIFTQTLGRLVVRVIPGIGIHVCVAIMISRLMLSIRKAAAAHEGWESFARPPMNNSHSSAQFAPHTVLSMETEAIKLDYLPHRLP